MRPLNGEQADFLSILNINLQKLLLCELLHTYRNKIKLRNINKYNYRIKTMAYQIAQMV